MHPLIESYGLKRQRARQHFDALHAAIDAVLDAQPYSTVIEADLAAQEYVVRGKVSAVPPSDLRLLIGDCLYNLRASLDHLAWALATLRPGITPPPGTEFPIFVDSDRYESRKRGGGRYKLRGLAPHFQQVIDTFQPFQESQPDEHPLWILQELCNEDKHRTLNLVGACVQEGPIRIRLPDGRILEESRWDVGPFDDGAEMGRIRVSTSDPSLIGLQSVRLESEFRFNVSFEPAGPGRGRVVGPTIVEIANCISAIAVKLEPFISPVHLGSSPDSTR